MKTSKKGNVLITGSSSGLGYYLANCFVKDGYPVFVNGKSDKKVNNVKKFTKCARPRLRSFEGRRLC